MGRTVACPKCGTTFTAASSGPPPVDDFDVTTPGVPETSLPVNTHTNRNDCRSKRLWFVSLLTPDAPAAASLVLVLLLGAWIAHEGMLGNNRWKESYRDRIYSEIHHYLWYEEEPILKELTRPMMEIIWKIKARGEKALRKIKKDLPSNYPRNDRSFITIEDINVGLWYVAMVVGSFAIAVLLFRCLYFWRKQTWWGWLFLASTLLPILRIDYVYRYLYRLDNDIERLQKELKRLENRWGETERLNVERYMTDD